MHRLFFAVVPDADARTAVARVVDTLRHAHGEGGWVAAEKWHETIVFLGGWEAFPADVAARAAAAAASMRESAPTVVLDRLGDFDGGRRPWYLGCSGPGGVDALAAAVRARLAGAGLAFDTRPFVPHLTVRRARGRAPAGPIAPIAWTAGDFVLFHSAPDAPAYRVLARFATIA